MLTFTILFVLYYTNLGNTDPQHFKFQSCPFAVMLTFSPCTSTVSQKVHHPAHQTVIHTE